MRHLPCAMWLRGTLEKQLPDMYYRLILVPRRTLPAQPMQSGAGPAGSRLCKGGGNGILGGRGTLLPKIDPFEKRESTTADRT